MIDNGTVTLVVIGCVCFFLTFPGERQSFLHRRESPGKLQHQQNSSSGSGRNKHRDSVSNRSVQLCEIEDSECELSEVDLSIPEDV